MVKNSLKVMINSHNDCIIPQGNLGMLLISSFIDTVHELCFTVSFRYEQANNWQLPVWWVQVHGGEYAKGVAELSLWYVQDIHGCGVSPMLLGT